MTEDNRTKERMVEMAAEKPAEKMPVQTSARPAPPTPAPPGPPEPGHKTASPDERMKAMEMAMSFHQGMHNDPQALVNTARAILDFVHDKSPA